MSKPRFFTLGAAALVTAVTASSALADARATLNQSKVALGDSFALTITSDDPSADPDLSGLAQEFQVLGTSQSMQTSIINGRATTSRGWTVQLAPKSEGRLTVPAIQVGPDHTTAQTIDVIKASDLPKTNLASGGLQIDMSAAPGPHYVNEEFPVTVRILDGVGLQQASLTDLSSPDFTVKQGGQDRVSQTTHADRPVSVIERTYLVTPLKSGDLSLPPLVLRGTVADPNGAKSPFGSVFGGRDPFADMRQRFGMPSMGRSVFENMFNTGKPIQARSEPLPLQIKAAVPGQGGSWFLPAKNVELKAAWDPATPSWKAGEAVTRVVQIVALGASQEKLPTLAFDGTSGMRIYVDRVDDRTETTPGGSAAIKQFTLSIVPQHGGTLTIPEVRVNWFDTGKGENAVAVLPSETIEVAGPPPVAKGRDETAAASATSPSGQPMSHPKGTGISRQGYLSAGAAVLALLGVLGLWRARRQRTHTKPATARQNASSQETADRNREVEAAGRDVLAACKTNDPARTAQTLQVFAALTGTDFHGLTSKAGARLASEISALETALFHSGGRAERAWRGTNMAEAFTSWREVDRKKQPTRTTGDLPPLYQGGPEPAMSLWSGANTHSATPIGSGRASTIFGPACSGIGVERMVSV